MELWIEVSFQMVESACLVIATVIAVKTFRRRDGPDGRGLRRRRPRR